MLSQNDYLNLVQCETLEDLKLHLQSTDYGNFLASESTLQVCTKESPPRFPLKNSSTFDQAFEYLCIFIIASSYQVSVIDEKLRDKLVTEFQHMRNHATGPLACFLDYIT